MRLRKSLIAALCAVLAQAVVAQEIPPTAEIKLQKRVMREPPSDLGTKKIHLTVSDSEKITRMLVDDIKAKGYTVVDDKSSAEVKMQCFAKFTISGNGQEAVTGFAEQLVQVSNDLPMPDTTDYTHQSTNLGQIAAPIVTLGIIPIPDILVWVTQKLGIAGAFNKALTSDPRGICLNENCNKFAQVVLVTCLGDVSWLLQYQAHNEKIVIDQVMQKALSGLRDQFPPLAKRLANAQLKEPPH